MWFYKAVNNSIMTIRLLKIEQAALNTLELHYKQLQMAMKSHKEHLDMYGFPQVDYIIRMIPISEKEIDDMIVNFQKSQIWQEKRLDFVSQWLEIDLIDHDMKDHIQKQETYEEVQ